MQFDVTLDGVTYRVRATDVTEALTYAISAMKDGRVVFNIATITDVTIKLVKS